MRVQPGYHQLTAIEKQEICNGAGAGGDWKTFLIPNKLMGLDCTEVFNAHDYAYYVGTGLAGKETADIEMLLNLIDRINEGVVQLSWIRKVWAITYYEAVHRLGWGAYFLGDKLSTIREEL